MSCLLAGLAALLALAVPASIAPTSLFGAYVVILVLAALAVAAALGRSRGGGNATRMLVPYVLRVSVAALAYGVVVTLIHAAA